MLNRTLSISRTSYVGIRLVADHRPDPPNRADSVRGAGPTDRISEGPSDVDLVGRLAYDDEAALAEIYRRYGRPGYSLARRICADDGLAEDVVQEVFLAVWRDPGRFDPARGAFATWLLTLIHPKAVDAVRRESAVRKRTVPAAEAGEDWSLDPVPGADQTAMARVAAGQVRDALYQLPDEQRQVLALAYYGGTRSVRWRP
jgi:RNA polymerase sigma factor (sigma-70 family)